MLDAGRCGRTSDRSSFRLPPSAFPSRSCAPARRRVQHRLSATGQLVFSGPLVDVNGTLVVLSSVLRSATEVLRGSCAVTGRSRGCRRKASHFASRLGAAPRLSLHAPAGGGRCAHCLEPSRCPLDFDRCARIANLVALIGACEVHCNARRFAGRSRGRCYTRSARRQIFAMLSISSCTSCEIRPQGWRSPCASINATASGIFA